MAISENTVLIRFEDQWYDSYDVVPFLYLTNMINLPQPPSSPTIGFCKESPLSNNLYSMPMEVPYHIRLFPSAGLEHFFLSIY